MENKNYDNIKLVDVYQPDGDSLVIEKPPLMSEIIKIARIQKDDKKLKDMDMVFTILAVGPDVQKYKIGDKILVNGEATPVNLIDSDNHLQIREYQIMGKVLRDDYKEIKRYFEKLNEVITPVITKSYINSDGKTTFN